MATPADKAKAQMALYGLAILQSAALRGSQAAADGVKRAVQFLQGVPSVPDLAGQAVRKVGDIMLPPTYPSTKPAPRPAWGPTAPSKPATMRVQPSQPSSTRAVTPEARAQPQYRSGASSNPAPVPAFGDRGAATVASTPTQVGPRVPNIPGVPAGYFEGSIFRSGAPDPWTTPAVQSRLEPFELADLVTPTPGAQPLLSTGFDPLQGVQLNLLLRQRAGARALVDYSTSSGATRPAGTALGGQAFSQAPFNVPESAREVLRGADGRPLVPIPEGSEYGQAAFGPGQDIRTQLSSWGLDPGKVDEILAQFSPSRNAMGGVSVGNMPSMRIPLAELDGLVMGTRQKTAMGVSDAMNLDQLRKLGLSDAESSYVLNKANAAPYAGKQPDTYSTGTAQGLPRANDMGNVSTVDLGQVSSPANASPRIPAGPVIGTATLGGLSFGAFLSGQQGSQQQAVDAAFGNPPAPGQTSLGAPTATLEAGANLPAVTGTPQVAAPVQPIAGSTNAIPGTVNPSSTTPIGSPPAPITRAPLGGQASAPVASAMGGGSVPQFMDSANSNYLQAAQNAAQGLRQDASQYKNIGDFYRVQSAYANAPGRPEQIIGALKGMGAPASVGIESEANFETWARKNPELAYQLQLQMQRRGPSQQTPQKQGVVLGTSFGTNTSNNAAGQAGAAALNATYGGQGPSEFNAALSPQAYETIQRLTPTSLPSF